ncbi:MAG: hypothetical protein HKN13_13215 [Rhodothermales bacterium]|nr:hypothetical protein [Rhodothermales bacterium]
MEINYLDTLDYLIVGFYMLMVAGVGIYVSRFNKQTSDYFKGGGNIPWGLSAISLFISGFSAFMFVGAAGFTYRNGGAAFILFSLALPAYLFGYFIYGRLWRRTRIDTPMEFLGRRFSPGTTYFYTVLSVIPNVILLGTMIYTLVIFVTAALGLGDAVFQIGPFEISGFAGTLVVTGIVMTFYTMLGGLWAVMVTDALQFIILFLISLIVLPVAFFTLGDGEFFVGVKRLTTDVPNDYFGLSIDGQPPIFWVAYFVNIILGYNVNWHIAQRYYSVPDERDTRKMALWCAGLSFILPMLWVIPVMTTKVMFPDLQAMWPGLTEPSEAAFVTLAMAILPHGLLGIMVAAIFAATMSSVDTTLNWMAAVVTKDVYVPVSRKLSGTDPSEARQLLVGRLSVASIGLIAIWIGLGMANFGGAFNVYLKANSLYSPPMFIPVIMGLVYTRTPWWSGMVAFGGGVLTILVVSSLATISTGAPYSGIGELVFSDITIRFLGIEMTRYEINTITGIVASSILFFGSAPFFRRVGAFGVRLSALEKDLATPAYRSEVETDLRGVLAYQLAGRLGILIGVLLVLFSLIAEPRDKAMLNAIAGVLAIAIGLTANHLAKRFVRSQRDEEKH